MGPYERLAALLAEPPYEAMTAEEAETALNTASLVSQTPAMLTPDEFVDLFTPVEFVAIEASIDPAIRKLVFRLRTRQAPLDINSPTVQQGLSYMVTEGLLTPERALAIGTAAPSQNITPRESIQWPAQRIWASDIISARKVGI